MANVVNNLRVNNLDVKKSFFNNKQIKEIYFNDILIWKNANPFVFIKSLEDIDLTAYGEDSMFFVNFADEKIEGSYSISENVAEDSKGMEEGQMIVEITTDGGK